MKDIPQTFTLHASSSDSLQSFTKKINKKFIYYSQFKTILLQQFD